MANIFVVIKEVVRDEIDTELVKAFTNEGDALQFKDNAEQSLTSVQSHIFYNIEEIELVGGNG